MMYGLQAGLDIKLNDTLKVQLCEGRAQKGFNAFVCSEIAESVLLLADWIYGSQWNMLPLHTGDVT